MSQQLERKHRRRKVLWLSDGRLFCHSHETICTQNMQQMHETNTKTWDETEHHMMRSAQLSRGEQDILEEFPARFNPLVRSSTAVWHKQQRWCDDVHRTSVELHSVGAALSSQIWWNSQGHWKISVQSLSRGWCWRSHQSRSHPLRNNSIPTQQHLYPLN